MPARGSEYRRLLEASWQARRGSTPRVRGPRASPGQAARPDPVEPRLSPRQKLRREIYEAFLRRVEARGGAAPPGETSRSTVRQILEELWPADGDHSLSPAERSRLEDEVAWEISGLGPLGPLFLDPTVSDVLVNGPREVWVDRFGRLERTPLEFDDEEHLLRLLRRITATHGRHVDEASPYVDVRMEDGSRLNVIIPPLSRTPLASIRRLRATPFRLEHLTTYGTLSEEMAEFLGAAVRARLNLLISGGAASGKTTLLNILGGFIPPEERVVTIEETAELQLEHPHVVSLESRLPNIEKRGEVNLRALVKNALRMRPDRVIVGEVRGAEVFDMLQAMNTGHEGSLTTVHANSPEDALRRLESLVLMGGFDLPSRAIRELLGAAFHLVVHTARFADGRRRLTSIGEVTFQSEGLAIGELFRFEPLSDDASGSLAGHHRATGTRPRFLSRLESRGFTFGPVTAEAAEGDR